MRGNWALFYTQRKPHKFRCMALAQVLIDYILSDNTNTPIYSAGAGWFVSHVVITEGEGASARQFTFPCDRWFDDGYDDKKLERILVAGQLPTIEGITQRECGST